MTAVYPSGIKSFGAPVVDATDVVYAAHINDLRDEVAAIESELGTGLKSSTWTGAFSQAASHANLAARLTNIERGIVTTSDVHTQYVKKAGDTMSGALSVAADVRIDGVSPGGLVFHNSGTTRYKALLNGSGDLRFQRYDGSGAYLSTPLTLAADGTLNLGSVKITGLTSGTASGDALSFGQVLASSTTLISGLFSGTNPVMNGTAAVGTSAQPARSDHVHPSDTSKVSKAGDTMSGALAMGANKITGLADGSATNDAVNKGQLDAAVLAPYVIGIRSGANQSISASSSATISYPSEVDPYSMMDTWGVVTLPSAGIWLATLNAAHDAYSNDVLAQIAHNGGSLVQQLSWATAGQIKGGWTLTAVIVGAAGDTVQAVAADPAGGLVNSGFNITGARFSVVKIAN